MKTFILAIALFLMGSASYARVLPNDFFQKNPGLTEAALSLQLDADDWPEKEDKVIAHCLTEIKERKLHYRAELVERYESFQECVTRWTTVDDLKKRYSN